MLDRASTCLETGGRQLLRAPKPCLRSRRVLHSGFWNQGSSDMSPTIFRAAASILDPLSDEATLRNPSPTSTPPNSIHQDGPLLEFLYPRKTLALLQKLSSSRTDMTEPRKRHWMRTDNRRFSTVQLRAAHNEMVVDSEEETQAKQEMSERLQNATVKDALWQLLRNFEATTGDSLRLSRNTEPGKQSLAWHLYSALPEEERSIELQTAILEYLVQDDTSSTAATRAIQIFDSLPATNRPVHSYPAAISAYVALQMIGPAIQLYEEATSRFNEFQLGADAILARTIRDDQWDLSFRVFRTFLRQAARAGLHFDRQGLRYTFYKSKVLWGQMGRVPFLQERMSSLLQHIHQFRHELSATEEKQKALALFVIGFVPHVMDGIINVTRADEDIIWNSFDMLFRDLRTMGLPTAECYDYAINQMLNLERYRNFINRRKIHLHLYQQFQQDCLAQSGFPSKPSRELIWRLLVQYGRHGSLHGVEAMIRDLHTFHAEDPFTAQALDYLIRFFADRGDVKRVHTYFEELRSRFPKHVNLRIVSFLLYACARRIDIPGTIEQFKRVSEEFDFKPNTACWNNLLLAYARADDLEGALQCFNEALTAGIKPDKYTYGPLLDLCAKRGDTEAFEALLAKAREHGMPVDSSVWFRSGYVQTLLNDGDAEGAEEVASGLLRQSSAGMLDGEPLTFTWNLLIQHYAIQGDVAKCRQLYQQMVEQNIPLDSWTYSGLMRSLIEISHTNAAYKVLRVTMVQKSVRVHAFHYALVMIGFLRERQYHLAMRAYKRMVERGVPQTKSSRQASLLVQCIIGLLKMQEVTDEATRQDLLRQLQKTLRKVVLMGYETDPATRQPTFTKFMESAEIQAHPQEFFGLIIMLFSNQGAYDLCLELFEAARNENSDNPIHYYDGPVGLLTAVMEAHFHAGEFEEVGKCWKALRPHADRITKTVGQTIRPQELIADSEDILDPKIKDHFNESRIAHNRRHVIHRAARVYIRSLLMTKDHNSIQRAQRTVYNLLVNGYVIDTFTWNELIENLAHRGRLVDAFSACEQYLMPNFPAWRDLNPHYIRRDQPGYKYMELRHYEVKKDSVMPKYKTLVVLAAAYAQVKKDEANGLGYDNNMRAWRREVLEKIAPMTVRALETMPNTGDRLQQSFFRDL